MPRVRLEGYKLGSGGPDFQYKVKIKDMGPHIGELSGSGACTRQKWVPAPRKKKSSNSGRGEGDGGWRKSGTVCYCTIYCFTFLLTLFTTAVHIYGAEAVGPSHPASASLPHCVILGCALSAPLGL